MKGKTTFTRAEADDIKRLISEKLEADKEEQKQIRDNIRDIGFYFSDFYSRKDKYDVAAFDNLVSSGKIIII